MIKLKCKNCGYVFEVSQKEFIEHLGLYRFCFLNCGGQIEIENIDELIELDLKERVKQNINKWLVELGGDETLSLIKRNQNQACYKLYKEEMINRGFIIK
jgi:peptide subunit release factor 1 (eRF1)